MSKLKDEVRQHKRKVLLGISQHYYRLDDYPSHLVRSIIVRGIVPGRTATYSPLQDGTVVSLLVVRRRLVELWDEYTKLGSS